MGSFESKKKSVNCVPGCLFVEDDDSVDGNKDRSSQDGDCAK